MKRIGKIILMTMLCSLSLLFAVPSFSIFASAATPPSEEGIDPQADIIEWIYMKRGAAIYKRLFNTSTGEWIGDWIFVREVGKHPVPTT